MTEKKLTVGTVRKWITAALSIALLSVASFFLYWGVRNYLSRYRIGRFYFGLVWIGFGVSILIVVVIIALKTFKTQSS